MMTTPIFKDYLFNKFLEWEKTTPKKRSSFTAFARWLSDNVHDVEVKQQVLDTWMNGSIPKDEKYVYVLAEKLGEEIYDLLDFPRPNPYLQIVNRLWKFLPEDEQKRIAEETEHYETTNESKRVSTVSKRRKARKVK